MTVGSRARAASAEAAHPLRHSGGHTAARRRDDGQALFQQQAVRIKRGCPLQRSEVGNDEAALFLPDQAQLAHLLEHPVHMDRRQPDDTGEVDLGQRKQAGGGFAETAFRGREAWESPGRPPSP